MIFINEPIGHFTTFYAKPLNEVYWGQLAGIKALNVTWENGCKTNFLLPFLL